MSTPIRLVLFDLDGTLLDTAPDLGAALNAQRAEHGLAPLAPAMIRPVVSQGSPALLQLGFGLRPTDSHYPVMRERLLKIYAARIALETRFFPGMPAVLESLERQGLSWGVVTNKPAFLTGPLLDAFDLTRRAACVVNGDTTPRRKPHPDQLLHACDLCHTAPADTLYVGDAERDVQAAHAAGMRALVALYGYIDEAERPETWNADDLLKAPADLTAWLQRQTAPRQRVES